MAALAAAVSQLIEKQIALLAWERRELASLGLDGSKPVMGDDARLISLEDLLPVLLMST